MDSGSNNSFSKRFVKILGVLVGATWTFVAALVPFLYELGWRITIGASASPIMALVLFSLLVIGLLIVISTALAALLSPDEKKS